MATDQPYENQLVAVATRYGIDVTDKSVEEIEKAVEDVEANGTMADRGETQPEPKKATRKSSATSNTRTSSRRSSTKK
jgi:hypothetical protein